MGSPKKPMDRQRKEAAQETADQPVKVKLHGRNGSATVTVLPPLDWAFDAHEAFAANEYGRFAEAILSDADYAKWCELRPSYRQVVDFLASYAAEGGQDMGESQAS